MTDRGGDSPSFAGDVEFQKLLAGHADVDLVRLMLEFAADAYPDLDRQPCLDEIDRLGDLARRRLQRRSPTGLGLWRLLSVVSETLYASEGFRGNSQSYYDPRNSYLNEVLARRLGIPISLGIVYLAVAERAGLSMYGVGTPGHFMLGGEDADETLYVDPFSQGTILDRDQCQALVEQLLGKPGVLADDHFRPATGLEIATRVLRNLKVAYVMESQWAPVVPIQERLTLLSPDNADEGRDLGLMYLRTGRAVAAIGLLEAHLRQCTDAQAEELRPYLRAARRLAAELN
jgi:regulator of sirC expression with transglutaminase-like and TPR domain